MFEPKKVAHDIAFQGIKQLYEEFDLNYGIFKGSIGNKLDRMTYYKFIDRKDFFNTPDGLNYNSYTRA